MGRLPVSDNPTPALAHFQVLYDGSLNLFYEAFFSNIYRFHKVPKNHSVLTSHNILDYLLLADMVAVCPSALLH